MKRTLRNQDKHWANDYIVNPHNCKPTNPLSFSLSHMTAMMVSAVVVWHSHVWLESMASILCSQFFLNFTSDKPHDKNHDVFCNSKLAVIYMTSSAYTLVQRQKEAQATMDRVLWHFSSLNSRTFFPLPWICIFLHSQVLERKHLKCQTSRVMIKTVIMRSWNYMICLCHLTNRRD